jgi:hypothetical protein
VAKQELEQEARQEVRASVKEICVKLNWKKAAKGFERKVWDRKSTLTDFGSASTSPGVALVRERDYDKLLVEDVNLKKELKEKLKAAGVSSVEIERPGNKLRSSSAPRVRAS